MLGHLSCPIARKHQTRFQSMGQVIHGMDLYPFMSPI